MADEWLKWPSPRSMILVGSGVVDDTWFRVSSMKNIALSGIMVVDDKWLRFSSIKNITLSGLETISDAWLKLSPSGNITLTIPKPPEEESEGPNLLPAAFGIGIVAIGLAMAKSPQMRAKASSAGKSVVGKAKRFIKK
ncbi:MAG: hypothetical protein PHN44_00660 [Candidatus Marinimicrobia bacterium]|nr:hypothetical protein [Candidatus Neomarinimicrobiota bacterium]MDD5539123.1 hypothetical protein [Candidatus Neomarinimicrobiota bacterium]